MYDFFEVYKQAFGNIDYNQHSECEPRFQHTVNFVNEKNINSVLDIGSGRGHILDIIKHTKPEIQLTSADLEKFHNVEGVNFHKINLCDQSTFNIPDTFDLVTCLDVLEHLTEDVVDSVFYFFSVKAKFAVVSIANHSDIQNGVELHLIQKDLSFWQPIIEKYFNILECKTEYGGRLYILSLESKNKNEK